MNANALLMELRAAMRDSAGRTMLDKDWYLKQFTLSNGQSAGFIARTDGRYRAYVYVPGEVVPGISWGQAIVLETAGSDARHFIGDVCPICFWDGQQWLIATPKKMPGRISNWGKPVTEATRFSYDNKSPLPGKVIRVGEQYSNSAVITGWYAKARKKLATGGLIKSSVAIVDQKIGDYDWMPVTQYIKKSPESMTIAALAKAKVAGIIAF